MDNAQLAGLKRKHAATQDPAKRNELANLLRAAGHDPDASAPVSPAPRGRVAPVMVTAEQVKPEVTADEAKPEPAKRRPGRPARVKAADDK